MTNPRCPKCNGILWTEPVLVESNTAERSYSYNIAQDGLEIRCICGFRVHLTGDHYRQYIKKKLVLKSCEINKVTKGNNEDKLKKHRRLPQSRKT